MARVFEVIGDSLGDSRDQGGAMYSCELPSTILYLERDTTYLTTYSHTIMCILWKLEADLIF